MVTVLDVVIRVLLVLATSLLFGIVFLAYLRLKNRKLLFISIGFGFFVVYALLAIPEIFGQPIVLEENLHLLFHLIALIFLLIGTLRD
ncbi:MAG TPA: hypothetical protein VJ574_06020 [Candidatus Bathyarchaeia archaeon]|nr:hypothetical protein [Candidatus Bathyarchaeia archaeon]